MLAASEAWKYVGVAVGMAFPDDHTPAELALIARQFSVVTPEHCMKPEAIQPREGEFTFQRADALVAFAAGHGKRVTGHCLVWHQACPHWFFQADRLTSEEWNRQIDVAENHDEASAIKGRMFAGQAASRTAWKD